MVLHSHFFSPLRNACINFLVFLNFLFIYFIPAARGLHCCVQASSSCGERGASSSGSRAPHCSGFSCRRARGSGTQAQCLWRVGSSWTSSQTRTFCSAGGFLTTGPPEKESESRSVESASLQPQGLYRILQARILEWVAYPFSSRSSQPRN